MPLCLKIISNDAFDASESDLWWIYCIWFLNVITQYEGINASEWITLMQLMPITASIYCTCCIRFLTLINMLNIKHWFWCLWILWFINLMYLLPQIHSLWSYWCLWIINHDAFDAYESNSDEFVASHSAISFLTMRPLMPVNHSVWCQWILSLRQCDAFAAWHSFTSIHLMPLNHSICWRWILWLINLMYLYNTHSLLYEIEI